jgi:hypothetical protein
MQFLRNFRDKLKLRTHSLYYHLLSNDNNKHKKIAHRKKQKKRNSLQLFIRFKKRKEKDERAVTYSTISVLMATWNVNGKRPGESLQHWITLDHLCPDVIGIA